MSARDYHEAIWKALPAGLEPSDLALRSAFLLEHVSSGERVLDVGCGEGRFAAALAAAGSEVVGVDIAQEPLRRARALHPELDLRLLDGEAPWDLPDTGFDVVWAGEVIEHVVDTAAWLSEVRRMLRPGGRLLLSTPGHGLRVRMGLALSQRAFARHFDPLGDHLRFYTRPMLIQLLQEFGFEQVVVRRARGSSGARQLLLARAVRSRF